MSSVLDFQRHMLDSVMSNNENFFPEKTREDFLEFQEINAQAERVTPAVAAARDSAQAACSQ